MPTFITLTLMIGGGVILLISVIWFYYRRHPRSAIYSSTTAPAPSALTTEAATMSEQALVPTEISVNSKTWRPPPREQLLRRQEALLRLTAAAPSYHEPARHGNHSHPIDLHNEMSQRLEITDGHAAHPNPAALVLSSGRNGTPRVSRIGRQRQGLESLITELPSSANDTDK
ncbi:hypothetical protein [Thiospirillum jenense]|uniref:Uncharacterized protein n=1 Tax=Thiospirillum jenense TaxID=1653858 RepID=A0A839HHA6_9GAMM|nr:hypothetical protein [Thiospirillum jenense]MBB1126438.1 hypothetical protein [Thiospirillum jenense]